MSHTYETTISHVSEGHVKDAYVIFETSERTVISSLERKPERFEIVSDDRSPGMPRLVRFRIPIADVNWAGLAKRQGAARPHLRRAGDEAFIAS